MKPWKDKGLENVALSTRIVSKQGCANICRQAFEYRQEDRPQARHAGREAQRAARDRRPDDAHLPRRWPRNIRTSGPTRRTSTPSACGCSRTRRTTRCSWPRTCSATSSATCAPGLVGGLGFAPIANLGDKYAVFEPTHGSAPKYAGQYKVNPIAMLLTAKMMLDGSSENDMATRLEAAVARVIKEGKVRTYDMGGKNTTLEVAKEVAQVRGGMNRIRRHADFATRLASCEICVLRDFLTECTHGQRHQSRTANTSRTLSPSGRARSSTNT